ncbi:hypothetical protein JCM18899A_32780 [Nocardioides sp. AN3]
MLGNGVESIRPHESQSSDLTSSTELLRIDVQCPDPDTVVVTALGEADISTLPALRRALDGAVGSGYRQVIVVLDKLTFMDAGTLDLLVQERNRIADTGVTMRVKCQTERGQLLFRTADLECLLD